MEDIEITYRKGNIKEALQLSLKYLQQNQNSQDGEKIVLLEGYKWLQKCLIHYHKFTEETVLTILTQQEYLELWNKVLEVHGYRHASIEQDILLNHLLILMNVFQGYEKAKQDAIKYLYPDAQVGVEIQPKPDCPVHELLLNFILPKVEDNCISMFSIPLSTSNSLVSTYKEEALQFSNTLFQKITFFWNILKYYIRERWDWSPWLERARFLVGGSDTHPGVSILAMIIVTWYLLRERKQRLSIRESAVSLFKLLSSPY